MPRKGKIPRFGAQGFPVRRDLHLDNQGPNNRPLNSRIRATVEGLLSAASNGSNGSQAAIRDTRFSLVGTYCGLVQRPRPLQPDCFCDQSLQLATQPFARRREFAAAI